MIKYYKAWLTYLVFLAVINVLGILSTVFMSGNKTFIDVIWQVITLIGLLGLFGYIKQVKIGSSLFWCIFLAVDLSLFLGAVIYFHMQAVELSNEVGEVLPWDVELGLFLPVVVICFPYWYGIFQYGFKSKSIWQ
jgi:hypothetical protein